MSDDSCFDTPKTRITDWYERKDYISVRGMQPELKVGGPKTVITGLYGLWLLPAQQ